MEDIIRVQDQFYVRATSSLADQRTRVLKDGDAFAVFDVFGDIQPVFGSGAQGFYDDSTRFLSYFELRIGKEKPLLLSSTVQDNNVLFTADLTNPDFVHDGLELPRGTIHLFRSKFIHRNSCYERIRVANFGLTDADIRLSFKFGADFADIFEIRGLRRERKGRMLPADVSRDGVTLAYEGLDGVLRKTHLSFGPSPEEISATQANYLVRLRPQQQETFYVNVSSERSGSPDLLFSRTVLPYEVALQEAEGVLRGSASQECFVRTSNLRFNDLIARSLSDLHMMVTETRYGPYPYAGIPWFSTVFGRDGLITALQSLWVNPSIAKGVLRYLAATQALDVVPTQDAEPGKILHEKRNGEMVALGEVPFEKYYGSIDSTPLFVILAGAYLKRTGDLALVEELWTSIERALEWVDRHGDLDGDGFVEYMRRTPSGLTNQGWKDSEDSVSHDDGSLARGPIALCEVQGYVYRAKMAAADIAHALGKVDREIQLVRQAQDLKSRFHREFWCEDLGTYALALDGDKRPCRVRSSNPGHCLYAQIADPHVAARVAQGLMGEDMFSGWGIRTLSERERRYNPMSYHNGSVWPHDNAIVAAGLASYGHKDHVMRILQAMFDASQFMELSRLPELFCGFVRRPGQGPTLYPVACSPQAWASGTVFMLIKAALGMTINAAKERLNFHQPALPTFLPDMEIRNLRVGQVIVDLALRRSDEDVSISVLRKTGPIEIVVYQ